jgi:hypothetical protein
MMTQNELSDLIPNVEMALPYVDYIIIMDGGSKDLSISYMRNWSKKEPKIKYYISPWEDDFPKQRNKYLARAAKFATPESWLLTADPDEYFSKETFEKLHKICDMAEANGKNMIGFQCRSVSLDGPHRVWENLDQYWKQLLIKWDPNFHYTGYKCHEGKGGIPHNIMDIQYSEKSNILYEHRKQSDIIWLRGMRNAFTAGGGPNLGESNPIWVKWRALSKERLNIDRWHDMYDYLLKGNIDEELKQLFIDHMLEGTDRAGPNARSNKEWDGASEMREMYKTYFRLLHPEEEPEELRSIYIP